MRRKQRTSRGNWFRLAGKDGDERRLELEKMLAPHELEALAHWHWEVWGRDEQHPPQGPWRVWLIKAGRGFGKTRAGAEWVRNVARHDPEARIALVGASLVEVRSVMVEGESGVLAASPGALAPDFEPSLRRLVWPNGAQAFLYSAGEPESLRGPQHSHAWCDEIAKWDNASGRAIAAWDNLQMGMRLGDHPRVLATSTPRSVALMNRLMAEAETGAVVVAEGKTEENTGVLPNSYYAAMLDQYAGTALGRQELDGEMLAEVEGALWSRALLEACRTKPSPLQGRGRSPLSLSKGAEGVGSVIATSANNNPHPNPSPKEEGLLLPHRRVVIGVDPPASSNGDACGIVVAALLEDGNAAVLADCSVEKASPERWARAVAGAAAAWQADRVVAEANQGGAMVASVLRAADITLPVKLVHASRGKVARAEPVAALYEAGRVKHAGLFARLEDELCGLMAGGGYEGPGRSPDRADALVWALSELMLGGRREPRILKL